MFVVWHLIFSFMSDYGIVLGGSFDILYVWNRSFNFVDPLWCGVRCRPLTKELMEVYYLYLYEYCI